MSFLKIENLSAKVNEKEVLTGINLELEEGKVYVLLGPNGAGKSTLSNILIGNPKYEITGGKILLNKKNITNITPDERAKKGLFMSFQHPVEIDGVTMSNFLRVAYNNINGTNLLIGDFMNLLTQKLEDLKMDKKFRSRFVNSGFSGGEKKRSEILQLLLLEPKFAILDEIDSGLDVDSMKLIGEMISKIKKEKNMGILLITHHDKFLEHIKPDKVVVLKEGKIVQEGDTKLLNKILKLGFN